MSERANSIDGYAKTISEVLKDKKYSIDYYQREYKWESKQLAELITDLTGKFLQLYSSDHKRTDVGGYPGYYLGSIIISQKGNQPFIVDGQQRLTTLTLLLTYLRRLQAELGTPEVKIDELIYSESYGEKSFNLDVPDRNDCMHGLFETGEFEALPESVESVSTLVSRYSEIEGLFPDELKSEVLPYFIDWLKDRVQIVQITAYNDDDAYAIFETMNDRGLKLTPADMLKGYLLANIDDGKPRAAANDLWRSWMRRLEDLGEGLSSDFLKTWLRSQYSTRIRERKKDATPQDWDRIGTEFHRWLRNDAKRVGLESSDAFSDFVTRNLDFYARQYERISRAKLSFDAASPLRFIRFNADHRFTLQDQMLLAPLCIEDDVVTVDTKLEIVGRFIDILLAWRIWNSRSTDYSTMQYAMTTLMFRVRGLSVGELARELHRYLLNEAEKFDTNDDLVVHQQNRAQLHRVLARITDHVTTCSGFASNYVELTGGNGVRYEVEHIWANHPSRHTDEFPQESDFARHRNRIGDLLLLPKQHNGSYNDDTYEQKRPRYYSQNLLAASLDPQAYEKNPGFLRFVADSGLHFRPYEAFTAKSITERGELYRAIASQVWEPADLYGNTGIEEGA
ncbi:DUF262 domain-containing protein [Glutamicibacter nicotianae]|uniref:DUF262 domain-containing protein n=1 Tax=Glutamicibacter nicotianae TaxID=37929 RepID=A0ABQ0RH32_GLUNI|nr:DUF262 domain-containing protein [Glutamicibacter nicotianae]GEC11082.1 hypothetical protein ANI01nite_02850 [Glutamicibacter nicotianae]